MGAEGTYFEVDDQYVAEITEVVDNEDGTYDVTVGLLDREETFTVGDAETMDENRFRRGVHVGLDATANDDGDVYLHAEYAEDEDDLGTAEAESPGDFATAHGASFTYEADYDTDAGTSAVHVTEADEEFRVTVEYDDGEVEAVHLYEWDGAEWGSYISLDDEEYTVSNWGSQVDVDGDVSVAYPADRLNTEASVGEVTGEAADGVTYETLAERGDLPNMAQLDTDITESDRDNNHLVLVGGPAVNTLAQELYEAGDLDLDDVEEEGSGAVLQTVENAFADGQHALVVAGYGADDTRNAAQYLSNYRANADALAEHGNHMVLTEADYPTEQ